MGSEKMKRGLLPAIGVLIVLLIAMGSVNALTINQFYSVGYKTAFNESAIPATTSTTCTPVCTDYVVNVTLGADIPVPGYIVIKFPVTDSIWFDISGAQVVSVTSSASFASWSYTIDQVDGEIRIRLENTTPIPNGSWFNISITGVCNPVDVGMYQPTVYTTTTGGGGGFIEGNDSINVTVYPGHVSGFDIYYWNGSAILPNIPNGTVSCPAELNPIPINISAVDACGNINTSANFFLDITEYYGGAYLGNGTISNGWLNLTVNISYTGWSSIYARNASTGLDGRSNDFWLDPASLGSFQWDVIASPQYLTYPFTIHIEAYDVCNNFKFDYNGNDILSSQPYNTVDPSSIAFIEGVFEGEVAIMDTSPSICPSLPMDFNLTVANATNPNINATSNDFEVTRIPVNVTLSEVTVSPESVPADETSYSVISITVREDSGAALKGVKVKVSSDRGATDFFTNSSGRQYGEATDKTDVNGKVSFKVSSHTNGTANITVEVWNGCEWVTIDIVQVTFTAQVANPGTSLIYVWNGSGWVKAPAFADYGKLANGSDYYLIKVVARDNEGNPVENVNVTIFTNSPNVWVEPAHNLTDANGETTFKVYSKEWGWFEINATVNGQLIWDAPLFVFFNPVLVVEFDYWTHTYLGCSGDNIPAIGVSSGYVVFEVTDLSGKPVPNVFVQLSSNKSADSIFINPVLTNSIGKAWFRVSSTNPAPSLFTANAYTTTDYYSATSSNTTSAVVDMWVAGGIDPNNSSISTSKTEVVIDSDYAIVNVTVRDANNNPVSNVNVTLVSSRPDYDNIIGGEWIFDWWAWFWYWDYSITEGYSYTNCSGVASFYVKSSKVGTSTFTAYVDGVEIGKVNITFSAPVCGYYVDTWYADDYLLNLEEKNTTTVHMRIVYDGTPVPDQVVKIESLSNCGENIVDVISPSNPVTDEDGWITFNITTDTAMRYYYGEGGSCIPEGEDNEVKLVVKIGECYVGFGEGHLDYDNPLDVTTVIDHGPKEKPVIQETCGVNETDYPWSNEIEVVAPYYVTYDTQFHLKEIKLLLKDGDEYIMLADETPSGPTGCYGSSMYTIYYEDFETSDGGWYATGSYSTWEWGEPLQSESQKVAMSNFQDKGWATGLGNNYHPAEQSYLYSPEINISGITGTIIASWDASIDFVWPDRYYVQYSIDGGPWSTYSIGDDIYVNNASTIQFRVVISANGDTVTDQGLYIDWFRVYYYEEWTDLLSCYGYENFWVDIALGELLQDETAYDFVAKAVYCKETPNGEYCLEAPLSDVYTYKIDTVGPEIELAKSSFNCTEAPYGYFYDFLGVDLTNDDFYVNLEGFSASYDYFFTLPYDSDWSKITWDNKYINVHFDHISLSGGDYIYLWSGWTPWTGGVNNRPIENWFTDVPVANITYNYWYEFPEYWLWPIVYGYNATWNDYLGSVHGDLWFKFPVTRDEVCWLSYEHNGYIFYYDTYPPNDGFNIDMITYGTGVKIYLWNDAMSGWEDITDQCTITEEGFTLPVLEPGTYRLLIVATDVVGNANHLETTFTVKECSARFSCSDLVVEPTTIVEGQNITASATITNIGEVASNYTAGLYIDGSLMQTLPSPSDIYPGEEWNVSFVYQFNEPGVYNVGIDTCPAIPVTVLSAANISVDYSVDPTTLCVMSDITVNVTVTNTGEQGVDYTVNLVVDGEVVDSTTVFVPGLSSVDLQFIYTMTEEGVHTVTVNNEPTTEVVVTGPGVSISNLQVDPLTGDAPLNITVSAEIANLGLCNVSINYTADLKVNGVIVDTQLLQLDPYESVPVVFEYTLAYPGTYIVTVDGLEGVEVNVTGTISPGDSDGDGWNDTIETLIASYYPDFNPATDTPTEDDLLNAVFGAVTAYFGTTDDAERAAILDDVTELVIAYFSNF